MKKHSHVKQAIYRQPWMMTEDGLDLICSIAERHACGIDSPEFIASMEKIEREAHTEFLERDKTFQSRLVSDGWGGAVDKKFYDNVNGVAVLRLLGPIFPRANLMTRMSGATALETWSKDFDEALQDEDVHALIICCDSPGGSVTGGFEMASKIFDSRDNGKPIVTLAEGVCASLAYLIGSQANQIYCTEASVVGSIGVVMAIEDDTRQSENEGVKRHVLKTGKNKAIGAGPVTDDQIAELKSMMMDFFGRFKDAISRARSVDIEKVSDGSLYIGKKAVDNGLVDGITTLDALIAEMQ